MRRKAGSAGIWHRTPLEILSVAPVPISVWTAIVAVEAVSLFGTVITMVYFPGSPSGAMALQGFLALSLATLIGGVVAVVVVSRRPRYSRHHRG